MRFMMFDIHVFWKSIPYTWVVFLLLVLQALLILGFLSVKTFLTLLYHIKGFGIAWVDIRLLLRMYSTILGISTPYLIENVQQLSYNELLLLKLFLFIAPRMMTLLLPVYISEHFTILSTRSAEYLAKKIMLTSRWVSWHILSEQHNNLRSVKERFMNTLKCLNSLTLCIIIPK